MAHDIAANAGFVSIDPATSHAVGGMVLVLVDSDGRIHTQFQAEDLDHVPHPDVQEEIGALVAQAFALANHPGFTR